MKEKIIIKKGKCKDCYYDTGEGSCKLERSCYLSPTEAYGDLRIEYYKQKRINTDIKWKLI